MNIDLFERKDFLRKNFIHSNFSANIRELERKNLDTTVIKVNILRATAGESVSLKNFLHELILSGKKNIILDLSRCEFIDSTFLSTIVSTNKMLNNSTGFIKLVISNKKQFSILHLTKIDIIFNIYPSIKKALNTT